MEPIDFIDASLHVDQLVVVTRFFFVALLAENTYTDGRIQPMDPTEVDTEVDSMGRDPNQDSQVFSNVIVPGIDLAGASGRDDSGMT